MKKICFVFFTILLASCSNQPKFTEKIIEKTTDNCEENCLSINFNYLICEKPNKFAQAFNKEVESQVVNFLLSNHTDSLKVSDVSISESLDIFMKDYNTLHQHFPDIPAYELILSDSISYQGKKMVSLMSNRYSYTGGANGISSTVFLNFDVSNGERISTDSLFKNLSQVLLVAKKHFEKWQKSLEIDASNETSITFTDDEFRLPQNIGFSNKYLILFYNPYEIAPYVGDSLELKIPIEEVKAYLNYID